MLRFHPDTKATYLASYHPGLTGQDVADDTGFVIDTSAAVKSPPPTAEDLQILRHVVDPAPVF